MVDFCSVNGQPNSSLDLQDRGLAYGDGLFETMRLQSSFIPLLEKHLQRLQLGCDRLFIPFQEAILRTCIADLISQIGDRSASGIVKLILTRGSGGKGYRPPNAMDVRPNLILQFTHQSANTLSTQPSITLFPCPQTLSSNPRLAGIKHLNRLEYVLAAQDIPAGADIMGLLFDSRACVIESLHHNLFMVKDGSLITPKLTDCGVAGIMRGLVMSDLCLELKADLIVREADLTIEDLYSADEIFLSNSVRGICHVKSIGNRQWDVGSVFTQMKCLSEQIWSVNNDCG